MRGWRGDLTRRASYCTSGLTSVFVVDLRGTGHGDGFPGRLAVEVEVGGAGDVARDALARVQVSTGRCR